MSGASVGGLTDHEHQTLEATAFLWRLLVGVVGDGPARDRDLAELAAHIHAIQNAVMAQAAARAHPELYRLMGEPQR